LNVGETIPIHIAAQYVCRRTVAERHNGYAPSTTQLARNEELGGTAAQRLVTRLFFGCIIMKIVRLCHAFTLSIA
jgi:hypothetical protein